MKLTNLPYIAALLLTSFFSTQGQNAKLDTVFVKRTIGENEFQIDTLFIHSGRSSQQVLAATCFLPYSDKMIGLLNHGLSPISLEIIQECDQGLEPSEFKNYPIFKEVKRDSNQLIIDVAIVSNCCHNFLGEAEVIGEDTLNLVYTSYGGFCSCTCCFALRYTFDSSLEKAYTILKNVTINGSETTEEIPEPK